MGTEDPPVIRRSLRILAKQKLKEDQLLQQQQEERAHLAVKQSGASPSVTLSNNSNSVFETLTGERAERKELADKPTSKRNQKRKRTPSPTASPPPNKPAKKSPDTLADSAVSSAVGSSEGLDNRVVPTKKRKLSKEETTRKERDERETVIVDFPRKGKSRSKAETTTELSEELGSSGKTVQSKRRKSKGKSKTHSEESRSTTSKGKGKGAINIFSLSSVEDFQRLEMASPE